MDTKKLVPLVLAALILIIGIGIYVFYKPNNKSFKYLTINYRDGVKKYEEVYVGDVYSVENIKLYVTSVNPTHITFVASESLLVDNKDSDTIDIDINEEKNICVTTSNCINISLK